jgi:hypothetical protein
MFNDSYTDRLDSQVRTPDGSNQDWKHAPTPGYYEHTPPSGHGYSPSSDNYTHDGPGAPPFPLPVLQLNG